MLLIFCVDLCCHERSDVALVANAPHEIGEPFPQWVSIKLPQQRRMMKSDPSSFAFLDVPLECRYCGRCPGVRRIVQLNEELVPRKKCIVDLFCVVDVVHRKVAGNRFFLKPDFGCIYKRPVNAVLFSEGDDPKLGLLTLSQHRASADQQQNHESAATANPSRRKTFAA